MNDPRFDKPIESQPKAYKCFECGEIFDENDQRIFQNYHNLHNFKIKDNICVYCNKSLIHQ